MDRVVSCGVFVCVLLAPGWRSPLWGAGLGSSPSAAPVGEDRARPHDALQQRHSAGLYQATKKKKRGTTKNPPPPLFSPPFTLCALSPPHQVNFYTDHTKIILCKSSDDSYLLTYITRERVSYTYLLSMLTEMGCTSELRHRLRYVVQLLQLHSDA